MEESYIFSNDINSLQHTLTSGHKRQREREKEKEGVGSENERLKRDRNTGRLEIDEEEAAERKRDDVTSERQ